jgi:hypothetical protein
VVRFSTFLGLETLRKCSPDTQHMENLQFSIIEFVFDLFFSCSVLVETTYTRTEDFFNFLFILHDLIHPL